MNKQKNNLIYLINYSKFNKNHMYLKGGACNLPSGVFYLSPPKKTMKYTIYNFIHLPPDVKRNISSFLMTSFLIKQIFLRPTKLPDGCTWEILNAAGFLHLDLTNKLDFPRAIYNPNYSSNENSVLNLPVLTNPDSRMEYKSDNKGKIIRTIVETTVCIDKPRRSYAMLIDGQTKPFTYETRSPHYHYSFRTKIHLINLNILLQTLEYLYDKQYSLYEKYKDNTRFVLFTRYGIIQNIEGWPTCDHGCNECYVENKTDTKIYLFGGIVVAFNRSDDIAKIVTKKHYKKWTGPLLFNEERKTDRLPDDNE